MDAAPFITARQRARPPMIYDVESRFCVKWIDRWKQATVSAVEDAAS